MLTLQERGQNLKRLYSKTRTLTSLLLNELIDLILLVNKSVKENKSPTNTSELINDGEDGVHPFITDQDIPSFTLQDIVNNGNGISNYGGTGHADIQFTNFSNNRTLYLNNNSFPTIKLVDNNNASHNLTIDLDTLNLNGTSYNWSSIVAGGTQNLQQVTDAGNHTTNSITVEDSNYYSLIEPSAVGSENKTTGSYTYIGQGGEVGVRTSSFVGTIKSTNLTSNLNLEFPNKTGDKTISTTDDLSSYVPYTGANQDVNLGNNNLTISDGTNSIYATPLYGITVGSGFDSCDIVFDHISVFNSLSSTTSMLSSDGSVSLKTNTNTAQLKSDLLTTDKIYQFPNTAGTLALTSDIPSVTPHALTKTNDTNVTLTLGGSPSTALLQDVSLTLGWTGTLADSRIASASTWNAKQNAITTGTTAQYFRGDLSLATFPTIPTITGLVPYTGANQDVNLGEKELTTGKLWLYDAVAGGDEKGSLHYADEALHFENSDGETLMYIEHGFMQLHKTGAIQSNLFTTNLTQNRDHYLPDNSGTIALTSDITGTNSGTNTGDETATSIKTKLGITTLSGSNTGDQDLSGLVPYTGATLDVDLGTKNLKVNNIFEGFTSVTASGTQIVLTTTSTPSYLVTGSGGQTIKLPNATTLQNGAIFDFNNNQSSGAISVNNNSNTLVKSIPSGGYLVLTLIDNSTAAGNWDAHFQAPSNVSWSTNTFDYAGSITSATWNGVSIADNRIASATTWNAKEDSSNKVTTFTGNETSTTKFPVVKAILDYFSATNIKTILGITTLSGSNTGDQDLSNLVVKNTAITGATKTKITYDAKGLVTSGADATTADIADSTNKRYVTDANLTIIGNQSGTNTGDETATSIKTKLGITTLSGNNTGDQDLSGYVPTTRTINAKALSSNVTLTTADVADSTGKRYQTENQNTFNDATSSIQTQLNSRLVGIHTLKTLPSGQGTTLSINSAPLTNVTGIVNRMILMPYIPNVSFTSSSLYINVLTLLASANARILIYSDVNGVPTTKLYESANLDCSTTGIKTATTAFSFVAGTTYWLCVHSQSTPLFSAYNASQLIPISASGSIIYFGYATTQTFGSAPTTITSPTIYNTTPPFVGINF